MDSLEELLNTPIDKLPHVDKIGRWTLIKLEIINEYAKAYSLILNKQPRISHVYIDAFSGAGIAIARESGKNVLGSALNAIRIVPPFKKYYFIDTDEDKVQFLREATKNRTDVEVIHGDSNKILIDSVFSEVGYTEYKRGLCVFDPYGLHLHWQTVQAAAENKAIEIFLNFPLMDMNMNVLWRKNPEGQDPLQIERMNRFWGDESWRDEVYDTIGDLFGYPSKVFDANKKIAEAFRKRLNEVAGFEFVPEPIVMRNTSGGELYYLFFASHNKTGEKIAKHVLKKYRELGRN